MTQAVQSGGSSYTYSYSYDAAGNRNSTGYATTTGNEMTSDGIWNYTYDNEGNEITKTKTGDSVTYGYDNANHLTSAVETQGTLVTSTVFKYDAFGNRLETDAGTTTTRYAYDGWDPAKNGAAGASGFDVWADLNGSSSLTTRYLRGDAVDQVFARMAYSGSTYTPYYYLTDAQGSIRDVIDASTNLKDTVHYDPYGTILSETNSSYRGRYGWDSRETDSSTGLIYNRARYYDPKTGRWLSQDPIGLAAGDSNLYRYVKNRPVDATDPSGLAEEGGYDWAAEAKAWENFRPVGGPQAVQERPVADGSNLQWITQAKMEDLVTNGLARVVGGADVHRVIFMPYGNQIRALDYTQAVNTSRFGNREWLLARSYGFAHISDAADVGSLLSAVDTDANASRLAGYTNAEGRAQGQLGALQTVMTAITLLPGGAAAEAITRGDYVNAAISIAGDVALVGSSVVRGAARAAVARTGAEAAAILARANTDLVRFRAIEGAIAVTRVGQAGYAVLQDQNGQAAGYLGEAALRIFGVAYARRLANWHIQGLTPLAGSRTTGVLRARALEVQLVRRTGRGTINWTAEEIAFIRQNGRLPDNIVGHHINDVARYPEWAGDPRNVMFVRGQPRNLAEHGGNFQNSTIGPLIDRQAMINQPGGQ